MGKFDGKKLLILGTSVTSIEIIQYAKSEGAYIIVADYLPVEKSAAKQHADEVALISTMDIDALCELGRKKHIDGVFCGVSEINLRSVNAVATRLGLPCYFTMEQWEATEDKAKFKELCQQFNVPVAKPYAVSADLTAEELNKIKYPVIVKPVDGSACRGVHVCYNAAELMVGYRDAYQVSFKKEVIVEEYIVGDEFTAYYTIIDGQCRLSAMGDKYLNREQVGLTPLPEAFLFPSKYLDMYLKKVNRNVCRMVESLEIKVGTLFVQGITDGNSVAVFEAGLRINGSEMYKVVCRVNGINIMHMLVEYSLTGNACGEIELENPDFRGNRACYLYLINRGGRIADVQGLDEACKVPGVIDYKVHHHVGDVVERTGTLKQRQMRFCLLCDSTEQLKKSIEEIQNTICVLDDNGKNMLLSKFDTQKVSEWGQIVK